MKRVGIIFLSILICIMFCFNLSNAEVFVDEKFEAPGYQNPMCDSNTTTSCWTEYVDTNCSLNDAYSCNDCVGSYCLYSYSAGYKQLSRIMWKLDQIKQTHKIKVRLKLKSHNLTNTKVLQPIVLTTDAGSKLAIIQLYFYYDVIYIKYTYWNGYGTTTFAGDWEVDITNECYRIELVYDLVGLETSLKINGVGVYNAELGNDYTTNPRKLWVGIHYNNGSGPSEVLIDELRWTD